MTMPIFAQPVQSPSKSPSNGARLVTADGRTLPLERSHLVSRAGGGLARSVLRQRFANDGAEALEVTYLLPLPADGAVSGYSFSLRGVTTRGKVLPNALARAEYEDALMQGKSAALLEQERSSVFRQAIGNVPPGETLEVEVSVDHPLQWIDGGWELRFPTVVAPRFQSGEERSATVPVTLEQGEGVPSHSVELEIADVLRGVPVSPSHLLSVEGMRVSISAATLDRDVVIRWAVALPEVGARLETAREDGKSRSFGLLTLVPPSTEPRSLPRDLIVLLDTSGSMAGEPLSQAVRIVSALVQSLSDRDSLELIEFGTDARRFREGATPANAETKRAALAWLGQLRAGGGTEMRSGIDAALSTLREGALRQVVLVTDGLIGFERQVLQQLLRCLPQSCRFHTVGVGHATNGSLLQPAARAGRGACIVVAPGEDVEPICARLLARTAEPLVVNLKLSGTALAEPLEKPLDLYSGAPALLPLALSPSGGTLEISGETPDGAFARSLLVAPSEAGSARLAALYARDRVEELELLFAAGEREPSSIDKEIEQLGVEFQIASRLTAWVAVTDAAQVDPKLAVRQVTQPQQLPAGMSAEGLGLRSNLMAVGGGMLRASAAPGIVFGSAMPPPQAQAPMPAAPKLGSGGLLRSVVRRIMSPSSPSAAPPPRVIEVDGHVRSQNDERLVLTFTVKEALSWRLPARVRAKLADGTQVELSVETETSTAGAELGAGQSVRLVCGLDQPLSASPRELRFDVDGRIFHVKLGA